MAARTAVAALAFVIAAAVRMSGQPAPERVSVWTGVFTDAQAERGSVIYLRTCAKCHGSDLQGNSVAEYPPLVGDDFTQQWEGPLSRLVERVRTGMPFDKPGTLTREDTVSLVSYLLRSNDAPAGERELSADIEMLERVILTRRSGS